VVSDLEPYQGYLINNRLNLSIVREVRSNIAIQALKAGLDHLAPAGVGRPER
jgi:Lrp/AsnC family transcriptional regulator, leucine-responsive regulatory protein